MKNLVTAVAILFAIIWALLSTFVYFIFKDEKKTTKDGSWKIFGAFFVLCLANTLAYGIFACYLLFA